MRCYLCGAEEATEMISGVPVGARCAAAQGLVAAPPAPSPAPSPPPPAMSLQTSRGTICDVDRAADGAVRSFKFHHGGGMVGTIYYANWRDGGCCHCLATARDGNTYIRRACYDAMPGPLRDFFIDACHAADEVFK